MIALRVYPHVACFIIHVFTRAFRLAMPILRRDDVGTRHFLFLPQGGRAEGRGSEEK